MIGLAVIAALLAASAIVTLIGSVLIERAHPAGGRRIDIGGLRQHVVELGPPAGARDRAPPLVFLHGAGCNLEDLRPLGERLAARHRGLLVDRPGQGWSEGAGRATASPAAQAEILRDLLDRLGIERAILVGHSWGGTLAATFALNCPDRVDGLALLAPATHPPLRGFTGLYAALSVPLGGWLFSRTLALPLAAAAFDRGLRNAFLPQAPPPRYIKRSAALLLLRPKTFLANARDLAGLQAFLARQAPRYGEIRVPTLIFCGDRDRVTVAGQHAMALAAAVPTAKLILVPGAGHMLHRSEEDRIVAAIEELIASSGRR
jgi:pimeloyl-ACP methyl ester carboxylesterase